MRAAWPLLVAILVALPLRAWAAFVVPPIAGHVTDTAQVLTPVERTDLEQRLEQDMQRSSAEIAVLVVASLEGETIEDVAYRTFNTWRIGREKLDDGVLLVIATTEHRLRIETGKGIGGRLTDLQASDIIEQRIAPRLREGRYHDAIAEGTDAIAEAIGRAPGLSSPPVPTVAWALPGIVLFLLLLLFLRRGSARTAVAWWIGQSIARGMRSNGNERGGGFFRGGGGYSGGGGRSGGGGASGRW